MFHHHNSLSILLIILMVSSTKAQNNTTCLNKCGIHTLPYPFGFSEGCQIRLNCSPSEQIQIGESHVQNVTSSTILINLPAKCNRSLGSIEPLFTPNFAPTKNNSLLVQNCSSAVGGCVIPTSSFMSSQFELDGCDQRSDNISCFTQGQGQEALDVFRFKDVNETRCKFLFSSFSIDQGKEKDSEVSLQFQMLELGWWLGSCQCSPNANCVKVNIDDGKHGFRCHCREGYDGDGFINGTRCRRSGKSTPVKKMFFLKNLFH